MITRIIVVGVILFSLFILFVMPNLNINTPVNITDNDLIFIEHNDTISDSICTEKGIKNKIIVMHQTGCPACSIAVPRLEELDNELSLGKKIEFINLVTEDGRERILALGIVPRLVPTVLINCKVYVGALPKDEYRKLILEVI